MPTEGDEMRHYHWKLKRRPPSRVDSSRPVRDAAWVAERDLKRLATAVVEARTLLGLTQEEFAVKCALSLPTIQRIEAANVTPRTKTYTGLDRGADWPAGTARRIVEEGFRPRPPAAPTHEWSAAERARMRDMSMTEVRETYEMFRRKSEYLAEVWMREVLRVKAEAEIEDRLTTEG